METRNELTECMEGLEVVSIRLCKLHNMIDSLILGMKQEGMEQQAVDCVETIQYCISDLKNTVDNRLQQIKDLNGNIKEKDEHE